MAGMVSSESGKFIPFFDEIGPPCTTRVATLSPSIPVTISSTSPSLMRMPPSPEPILVAPLFAPLNDELIVLLRGLSDAEWTARAVGTWTVKDVAAHLLDTSLRRLSVQRDRFAPPFAAIQDLAALIN